MLAIIETDKASFDLESTATGKILALFWDEDDDVPVLANVAVVGNDGKGWMSFGPMGRQGSGFAAESPSPDRPGQMQLAPSTEVTPAATPCNRV